MDPEGERDTKKIRQELRNREFKKWSEMKMRGAGVCLFGQEKSHNKWLTVEEGLTNSERTDLIKMCTNTSAVRGIPGRSTDGTKCRRCCTSTETEQPNETLAHILGKCPYGLQLRLTRHNIIRSIMAKALGERTDLFDEIYEEVHGIQEGGGTRRIDIIAIDRKKKKGIIVDPTIKFESTLDQPEEVHKKKRDTYEPTIAYYKDKYQLHEIEIIGVMIGARGTVTTFCKKFCERFHIREAVIKDIVQTAVRGSINILRNHLYGQ